jgi:AhpD family alkylhydroperoxidase
MMLDPRTSRLVAVGASVAAGCLPCLETNVGAATRAGASPRELADAIAIGRMVCKGAARKLDRGVERLNLPAADPPAENDDCGCGS